MPSVSTEEESLFGEIILSNIPTPDLHTIKEVVNIWFWLFFAFLIKGYFSQSIDRVKMTI